MGCTDPNNTAHFLLNSTDSESKMKLIETNLFATHQEPCPSHRERTVTLALITVNLSVTGVCSCSNNFLLTFTCRRLSKSIYLRSPYSSCPRRTYEWRLIVSIHSRKLLIKLNKSFKAQRKYSSCLVQTQLRQPVPFYTTLLSTLDVLSSDSKEPTHINMALVPPPHPPAPACCCFGIV